MTSTQKQHRLNAEILAEALANDIRVHPDDVDIKSFEVTGGSDKGDNFNSVLHVAHVKATARGKEYERSYMAKSYPMSEAHEAWLREV